MLTTPLLGRLRVRALSLLLLPLCFLSSAMADDGLENPSSPFRLSGFATLGLTHNDNSDAGAIVSYSQKRPSKAGVSGNLDSVLGLQLDWQALPDTSVVVQGVTRVGNDMEAELRMAYLRQQFGNELAVRVGRIRSPLYFDSDVAEIGYAYLMSRPPIPLYGIVNSVSSIDGVDVQWRHSVGNAALLLQAYYGNNSYEQRFYNLDPVSVADGELKRARGLALSVSLPNIHVRASRTWFSGYTLRSDQIDQLNQGLNQLSGGLMGMAANPFLPTEMAAALSSQANQVAGYANPFDNRPVYTSVGFDANMNAWRLLGEWTYLDSRSTMVGKYEGVHLALAYNLGEFTPYVSVARQRRKGSRFDTSALAPTNLHPGLDAGIAQMKGALNDAARFADISTRSVSVGMRWDFRENMAMKMQYDRLQTPNSNTPGNFAVSRLPFNNTVNLFTVALDVVF